MSKCKVIAISNQKGGVGKTTTTLSLGVALSKLGKKVLLVDTDPQGDLTICMGYYNQDEMNTIANLIDNSINDLPLNVKETILHHQENIDLIPSNLDLSAMEIPLMSAMNREFVLKNCLKEVKDNYDYIIIDCQPSLGMITINALATADKVIIPVQTQYLAAKSMGQLMQTVSKIKRQINPHLNIGGILLTLVDERTNLSKDTQRELKENYGNFIKIYDTKIPSAVKVAESTSAGKSIFSYDKNSRVAEAYYKFAKEVDNDGNDRKKNAFTFNR
ncbi:MAG: ParA family protein [Firmicutes bacterium]|nr:ParA family protein [Bacillota bacterium]